MPHSHTLGGVIVDAVNNVVLNIGEREAILLEMCVQAYMGSSWCSDARAQELEALYTAIISARECALVSEVEEAPRFSWVEWAEAHDEDTRRERLDEMGKAYRAHLFTPQLRWFELFPAS